MKRIAAALALALIASPAAAQWKSTPQLLLEHAMECETSAANAIAELQKKVAALTKERDELKDKQPKEPE